MSLPLPVIDRLFGRLSTTYGRDFVSSLEGSDINAVKSLWAHELSGFGDNLQALAKALEILPERVPNVIQFKNICLRQLPADMPALPPPATDPAFVKAVISAMKLPESVGQKDWAKSLRYSHEAGAKLSANQVRCYKNALGLHASGAQL